MTPDQVKIADGRPMLIAGFNKNYAFAEMSEIPALWQELVPYLSTTPHRIPGADYGVCHDFGDSGFCYLAGFEVKNAEGLPEGFSSLSLPAQRYAVFPHEGDLSTLCETIDYAWKEWLPQSGEQPADRPLMFERYGPLFNPHLRRGDIEIWLALKG